MRLAVAKAIIERDARVSTRDRGNNDDDNMVRKPDITEAMSPLGFIDGTSINFMVAICVLKCSTLQKE